MLEMCYPAHPAGVAHRRATCRFSARGGLLYQWVGRVIE